MKVGDRVRVIVRDSAYFGCEGVVESIQASPDFDSYVLLNGGPYVRGFDVDELELIDENA